MKQTLFSLLLLPFLAQAAVDETLGKLRFEPYRIVIIADEGATKRAGEYREYLMKKPPFNKLDPSMLEIKIVAATKADMDCKNTNPKSPRIVKCNKEKLNAIKAKEEAHLALAFTSNAKGGGGGDIPVASEDYPIQTMLHEMLHTYGMRDEYCYSDSETEVYCNPPRKGGNQAHFRDTPPYQNDVSARVTHDLDVPWMMSIPKENLITQGSALGSKEPSTIEVGKQKIGLYRGGSCDKKKVTLPEPPFQSWRPYPNSIMRGYVDDTIYPMYEEIIIRNIESKIGRVIKRIDFDRLEKVDTNLIDPNCPGVMPVLDKKDEFEEMMKLLPSV